MTRRVDEISSCQAQIIFSYSSWLLLNSVKLLIIWTKLTVCKGLLNKTCGTENPLLKHWTAVCKVWVRSRPWACFQRNDLRLELSHVHTWVPDEVLSGKANTVHRSDNEGLSLVLIISEHVKDLTIKMAIYQRWWSPHPTSNIAYNGGVMNKIDSL